MTNGPPRIGGSLQAAASAFSRAGAFERRRRLYSAGRTGGAIPDNEYERQLSGSRIHVKPQRVAVGHVLLRALTSDRKRAENKDDGIASRAPFGVASLHAAAAALPTSVTSARISESAGSRVDADIFEDERDANNDDGGLDAAAARMALALSNARVRNERRARDAAVEDGYAAELMQRAREADVCVFIDGKRVVERDFPDMNTEPPLFEKGALPKKLREIVSASQRASEEASRVRTEWALKAAERRAEKLEKLRKRERDAFGKSFVPAGTCEKVGEGNKKRGRKVGDIRRTVHTWVPERLLCKRLRVPVPAVQSNVYEESFRKGKVQEGEFVEKVQIDKKEEEKDDSDEEFEIRAVYDAAGAVIDFAKDHISNTANMPLYQQARALASSSSCGGAMINKNVSSRDQAVALCRAVFGSTEELRWLWKSDEEDEKQPGDALRRKISTDKGATTLRSIRIFGPQRPPSTELDGEEHQKPFPSSTFAKNVDTEVVFGGMGQKVRDSRGGVEGNIDVRKDVAGKAKSEPDAHEGQAGNTHVVSRISRFSSAKRSSNLGSDLTVTNSPLTTSCLPSGERPDVNAHMKGCDVTKPSYPASQNSKKRKKRKVMRAVDFF